MDPIQYAIESVRAEIDRIVAQRQELSLANATPVELDANRRLLLDAQSRLSGLLIQRQLRGPAAA
jgi:hypothetical protein